MKHTAVGGLTRQLEDRQPHAVGMGRPPMQLGLTVKNGWGWAGRTGTAKVLGVTNAKAESLNAKIKKIKRMACGYRNKARFHNAILFHLGGLDLQPCGAATHTRS